MKNYFIAKSRRLRSTPYTSRIENQGVTAYSVYNHMLLPAAFGSLEDSYHHLKEHVQVWDVAGERQVEISGKDSGKLIQLMTCRDLSKSKVGRCYYCPIIDDKAGLINDPVILKLDYIRLEEGNSYVRKNRREFYKKIKINSPRNSPRKLRSGRTGQRISGVPLEKQKQI